MKNTLKVKRVPESETFYIEMDRTFAKNAEDIATNAVNIAKNKSDIAANKKEINDIKDVLKSNRWKLFNE